MDELGEAALVGLREIWEKRDDPSKQLLMDFKFVVCDKWTGSEETFHVSKLISATQCEAFAGMLRSEMHEASTGEVRVEDCTIEGFCQFLGCLHGVEPALDASNVASLLQVADKYCHSGVAQMCHDWIGRFVKDCGAELLITLLLSLRHNGIGDDVVKEKIAKGSALFDAPSFHLLPADVIEAILKTSCFPSKTESQVFERCIEWSKKQATAVRPLEVDAKSEDSAVGTDDEWQTHLKPLLPFIRFPQMSSDFLRRSRKQIATLVGSDVFSDILFQKDGYKMEDPAFCCLPRQKLFDVYNAENMTRTPSAPVIAPFFSLTCKRDYTGIFSALPFADFNSSANVTFAFKVAVVSAEPPTVRFGVAADLSSFASTEPFCDGGDWVAKDCWYIGSHLTSARKDARRITNENRAVGRKWEGQCTVRVSLEYQRAYNRVHFCAWLQESDSEVAIYDFEIDEWPNQTAFYPFILLHNGCKCEVEVLRV